MKAQHSAKTPLRQGICLAVGVLMASGLLQAAPGGNGGGGNTTPPPPIPYVAALNCITPGTTMNLEILGQVSTNEAYVQRRGNASISGSFSGSGLTINSITVNFASSLTLNITAAASAALTTRTLTIINPDGQTATSTAAVICVTDVPQITAAEIAPTPPSVIDDIEANVTGLINLESTFTVHFEYQWYENGVAIAQTGSILPASATVQSRSYYCEITPVKNTSIRGIPTTTPAVTVSADADNNGLHDAWESSVLSGMGADPTADGDGDGLNTLAEYLFGLDPNDARSNRPIANAVNPQTGEFEYRRAVNKIDGVSYKIWTSPDLVNWTEQVGASQSVTQANANSEVVRVSLSPSLISANFRLFVRVSAE